MLLAGCSGKKPSFDAAPILTVMDQQEQAWNRGDLPGFMSGYSDTICFIGSRGMTCGRDEVTANYVKSYPDARAMGKLTFGILEVVPAGEGHAWVSGTWALARTRDTLSGGYSLLWVKESGAWRIVRDHSY